MNSSYKTIHWGLLLLAFNFYIGNINIMPDFLGFILISKGLSQLIYESSEEYFRKAKRISNLMIGISLIQYILSMYIGGSTINFTTKGIIFFTVGNFIGLLSLVIIYNILKGIYIEAENRGAIEFMDKIKNAWNIKLFISLVMLLLGAFTINQIEFALVSMTIVSLLSVIVQVWIAMLVKRAGSEFS